MTKTTPQAAAVVLSALMSLATVAGMNGIATKQYAKADSSGHGALRPDARRRAARDRRRPSRQRLNRPEPAGAA